MYPGFHQYGFLRPYVKQVIYRYLDCGIKRLCSLWSGIVAIQALGDFPLGFHPHLDILVSDG